MGGGKSRRKSWEEFEREFLDMFQRLPREAREHTQASIRLRELELESDRLYHLKDMPCGD
jgi:hypothetical protein